MATPQDIISEMDKINADGKLEAWEKSALENIVKIDDEKVIAGLGKEMLMSFIGKLEAEKDGLTDSNNIKLIDKIITKFKKVIKFLSAPVETPNKEIFANPNGLYKNNTVIIINSYSGGEQHYETTYQIKVKNETGGKIDLELSNMGKSFTITGVPAERTKIDELINKIQTDNNLKLGNSSGKITYSEYMGIAEKPGAPISLLPETSGSKEPVALVQSPKLAETHTETTAKPRSPERKKLDPFKSAENYNNKHLAPYNISQLQDELVKVGNLQSDKKTGKFDKDTFEAVKKFQEKNKLKQDGKVGPRTKGQLWPTM